MINVKSGIDLKELMKRLSNLTYYSQGIGELRVIHSENLPKIENTIHEFLLENRDERIGNLEAKVYAYEKIIANSNFAPILESKDLVEKVPNDRNL